MSSGKPVFEKSYLIAEVSETLADDIIDWCYENISEDSLYFDPEDHSFGRESYIHMTVLSCIDDSDKNIIDSVSCAEKINVLLGNIKLFTMNAKFDVVMIEVLDGEPHFLNKNLSKNILNKPDFPKYVPHVTIAYVKKGHGEKFTENRYFNGRSFDVNELIYSHKSGRKLKLLLGKS